MAVKLDGTISDITTKPLEDVSNVTIKAAMAQATGSGVTITQPQRVEVTNQGQFSITVLEGVKGWLYVEGPGWSDSIPFIAAYGMSQIWEAIVNALNLPSKMAEYLDIKQQMQSLVDEAIANAPSSLRWYKGKLGLNQDLNQLTNYGVYESDTYSVAKSLKNSPAGSGAGGTRVTVTPAGSGRIVQEWLEIGVDGPARRWHRARSSDGSWLPWQQVFDGASVSIPQGANIDDLTTPNFYQVDDYNTFRTLKNIPGKVESAAYLRVTEAGGGRLLQEWTVITPDGIGGTWRRVRFSDNTWTSWEKKSSDGGVSSTDFATVVTHGDSQVGGEGNWPDTLAKARPEWKVTNWGVGGARPDEILLQDGARGVFIQPGVVLKPKTEIPVTLDWDPMVRTDGTYAVLGTIGNRSASLKYSADKSSWVVYLSGGNEDLPINKPTKWIANRASEKENAWHIVWFGGNAIRNKYHHPGQTLGQHVIRAYCDALDAWGPETIMCGYVPAHGDTDGVKAADEIRDWAAAVVPTQFLDMRNVLQTHAAEILGTPLSEQDTKDIAAGYLPRAMYIEDGVHMVDKVKEWTGRFMAGFTRGATPRLTFYSSRAPLVAPSGAL